MTLARALIAEIPALRRFSRALFGNVTRADSCVEAMLTDLLTHSAGRLSSLSDGHEDGFRLNLLASLIATLPPRLDEFDPCGGCAMEKSTQSVLHRLPKRPLLAFLLRTLEGLNDDDIAYVMKISPLQARLLIELGSASIAGEISTKVLIIEGDPIVAGRLSSLIEELGHEVCGIAGKIEDAMKLTTDQQPGLIISELLLPDHTSTLELLFELLKIQDAALIIVTEYPDLWKNIYNIYPAGLITKPFLNETVRATISKALFFDRRSKAPFWNYENKSAN